MTTEKRTISKSRKVRRILRYTLRVAIVLLLVACVFSFVKYKKTHFRKDTLICGVDCSNLTVEQASEKLNMELRNQKIIFEFSKVDFYDFDADAFNLELAYAKEDLQEILNIQNEGDKTRTYSLDLYSFDENQLRTSLKEIFDKKEFRKSKNAYLTISDSNYLEIVPEFYGNEVNFEEAFSLAKENLRQGFSVIYFEPLIIQPTVLSDDAALISKRDSINSILKTKITLNLANDSVIKLDNTIMVDWLVHHKNGDYTIDIDSNLTKFVEYVAEEAANASSFVLFDATDFGSVTVPLAEKYQAVVDIAQEKQQLIFDIRLGNIVTREPIYTLKPLSLDNASSYVELDISRQTVFMYENGKLILETPCVTGNVADGYSTPDGLYYLTYKTTDDYLEGYNKDGTRYKSFVNYWMPFNGGIGFHDALWRKKSEFGGNTYLTDGSHGCVNLPLESAKTIYDHIDTNIPIIVYHSETK